MAGGHALRRSERDPRGAAAEPDQAETTHYCGRGPRHGRDAASRPRGKAAHGHFRKTAARVRARRGGGFVGVAPRGRLGRNRCSLNRRGARGHTEVFSGQTFDAVRKVKKRHHRHDVNVAGHRLVDVRRRAAAFNSKNVAGRRAAGRVGGARAGARAHGGPGADPAECAGRAGRGNRQSPGLWIFEGDARQQQEAARQRGSVAAVEHAEAARGGAGGKGLAELFEVGFGGRGRQARRLVVHRVQEEPRRDCSGARSPAAGLAARTPARIPRGESFGDSGRSPGGNLRIRRAFARPRVLGAPRRDRAAAAVLRLAAGRGGAAFRCVQRDFDCLDGAVRRGWNCGGCGNPVGSVAGFGGDSESRRRQGGCRGGVCAQGDTFDFDRLRWTRGPAEPRRRERNLGHVRRRCRAGARLLLGRILGEGLCRL
mmetsp:Transcript_28026/g.96889  ORF Transcript_28026/g.96889 Transcript_28026/m.96889 type:complete len:426 (+) Transcript_28026:1311-2588(+)